jgi:hypothetical protein
VRAQRAALFEPSNAVYISRYFCQQMAIEKDSTIRSRASVPSVYAHQYVTRELEARIPR